MTPALAYSRTSSASNVGADKNSEKRQREAIAAYARRSDYQIAEADWFYDPAVRGADALEARPGFGRLLDRIEANGVRVVIVEDASRFARDLMTQELGIMLLIKRGVRLLTAGGDDLTASDDPTRKMMRQIAGAFAEYEKSRLVLKLKGARERKKAATGRCEGRRPIAELQPEATARARELFTTGLSSRATSAQLAAEGFLSPTGKPFHSQTVCAMTAGAKRKPSRRAPASR